MSRWAVWAALYPYALESVRYRFVLIRGNFDSLLLSAIDVEHVNGH